MMKHIPNILTFLRIALCVPLLLVSSPSFPVFFALYAACGLSDVLDGLIARKTGTASKLGAALDSVADGVFDFVVIVKFVPFAKMPNWIPAWIVGIAFIKLISLAVGYCKYRAVALLHTYASKAAGGLIFSFPLLYAISGMAVPLACIVCSVASLAAVEELIINIISPKLAVNVKSIFTL